MSVSSRPEDRACKPALRELWKSSVSGRRHRARRLHRNECAGVSPTSPAGESTGGIAPPAALRTGRDGLPSSGPHRPAVGECDELPVGEEFGVASVNPLQPFHRP